VGSRRPTVDVSGEAGYLGDLHKNLLSSNR
jgi:hypothetical protein